MNAFQVAAAFGMLPLFQSPMNILCEISNVSKRGFVICIACVGWSLGQILMPLVGEKFDYDLSVNTFYIGCILSLPDRFLEDYQDCLCRSSGPLLLYVEDVAGVSEMAGHQGKDKGGCQNPHKDCGDQWCSRSTRSQSQD